MRYSTYETFKKDYHFDNFAYYALFARWKTQ